MRKGTTLFIYIAVVAMLATACHGKHDGHNHDGHDHEAEEHEAHGGHEGHEHEEGVIHFSEKQMKAAGLKVETVAAGEFSEVIRVSGQVMAAQGDEAVVVAKSSGVLNYSRDHLTEGVAIRQGEVFAHVSAAGIAGGDEVAMNHVNLRAAKAAYDRAVRLYADTIISKKELERLQQEYEQARLSANTSTTATSNVRQGSAVTSPLTGFVKSVLVKQGEYVTVGQPVATVTKSCNLQLRAEVPEKHFAMMHSIRSANFEMSYGGVYSLEQLKGHLVSMGKMATEGSAYIPMTFEFENRGNIVPGAFADIWLLGTKRQNVISVPNASLTEEQGVYFVYVQLDDEDEFEKREVTIGMTDGKRTEILSGLKAGEKVVTHGVYQVKLASGNVAPEAHSHSH